eukprot:Gb_39127 [translate_table: standard]
MAIRMTDLLSLPEDAIIRILNNLTFENLITVSFACKTLYRLAVTDSLWMNLCQHWQGNIDVKEWRSKLNSGKALFQLLVSLSKFVGCWSAKELSPRGGILYVKWGHLCLNASRIWTRPTGDIILKPLFKVIGLPDGSFKIHLYTGDSDVQFPVKLIWSSKEKMEFHFELCESSEASSSHHLRGVSDGELRSNISDEVTEILQTSHLADMVQRLGPDHRVLGSRDEILDINDQLNREQFLHRFLRPCDNHQTFIRDLDSTTDSESLRGGHFGHRAIKCFMRMYTFDNITVGTKNFMSSKRINKSLYEKLKVDEPKSGQELAGLWSGIYGPHGLEIVNVSYTNDEIIATKLLGDPNVPCGEVTFKVTISSANTDTHMDFQGILMAPGEEDAFDISRMYRGRGRIAAHGFHNPKWVPGRLLVQHKGNMAFLWEDVNFVIRFRRLNLESVCPESN